MPTSAEELARSMVDACNANEPARAVALARQAPAPMAGSEQVQALLGVALQQAGRFAEAAEIFARLSWLRPDLSS